MSVGVTIRVHGWKDEPVEIVVEGGQVLSGIRETCVHNIIIISGRVQHFIDEITARSFCVISKLLSQLQILNGRPGFQVKANQKLST